jgi:NFU1 iron-sulfur cluster scaffold homolog, mitochondrial
MYAAGNLRSTLVRKSFSLKRCVVQEHKNSAPTTTTIQQIIRSIFIQTLSTPNPESLKFVPGIAVLEDKDETGNGFFVSKNDSPMEILRSPLAKRLFDVDGVKSVYLGTDFITVTKYAEMQWRFIRADVYDAIMEFAETGEAALRDEPILTDTSILDDDDEVVAMIKELIETKIRPAVQEDGGDIRYVSFEEETGLVTVKLAGSCVGCPSSSVTLKQGVENMLKHYIREVTSVVALEEPSNDASSTDAVVNSESSIPSTTTANESTTSTEQDVTKQQKTYEERLAAAGIPFSD